MFGCATTDASGTFTISLLPEGNVVLHASNETQDYFREFYTVSGAGTTDCNQADEVAVTAGSDTSGINFTLEQGGSVSGTVFDEDGVTPIQNLWIIADSDPCRPDWLGVACTNSSGEFTIHCLPAGNVYVVASPLFTAQDCYITQWHGNATTCGMADPVEVFSGMNTPNIDFIMDHDNDCDEIPEDLENTTCTDPNDADTDDDGIIDGFEDVNQNGIVDPGETNPCNVDSDSDGIQDGTETGLTLNDIGSDTDTGIFIPDADPATTSDPILDDTDGDGLLDGEEDQNHNGQVDEGESDPNVRGFQSMPWIPFLLLD